MTFLKWLQSLAHRIVHGQYFEASIISVILLNAAVIAFETYDFWLAEYGTVLTGLNRFILFVFVVETRL